MGGNRAMQFFLSDKCFEHSTLLSIYWNLNIKWKTPPLNVCFISYEYIVGVFKIWNFPAYHMCFVGDHVRRWRCMSMVGLEQVARRNCRKVSPSSSASNSLLPTTTIPHVPLCSRELSISRQNRSSFLHFVFWSEAASSSTNWTLKVKLEISLSPHNPLSGSLSPLKT